MTRTYIGEDSTAAYLDGQRLLVGEEVLPRLFATSAGVTIGSGNMRLTWFNARKTETITRVRTMTGTTAAGATPTLCKVGLYRVDPDAAGRALATLVAATANDTALWAAINTSYTSNLLAPYLKLEGVRYGVGAIIVTGAATPTFCGWGAASSAEAFMDPPICSVIGSLSDLPASFLVATGSSQGITAPYAALLP